MPTDGFAQPTHVCLPYLQVNLPLGETLAKANQGFGRMLHQHGICLLLTWGPALTLLNVEVLYEGLCAHDALHVQGRRPLRSPWPSWA